MLKTRLCFWLSRLALVAVLAPLLWQAVETTRERIKGAGRHLGESLALSRTRMRRADYLESLAGLRNAIPENAEYLILDASRNSGDIYWIRFDLAPRRPVYGGTLEEIRAKGLPKNSPRLGVLVPRESSPSFVLLPEGLADLKESPAP